MNWIPKKNTIYQILLWGGIWAMMPFLLMNGFENRTETFLWRGLVTFLGIGILVWVNLEVLVPKLYFNKNKLPFILISFSFLFILVSIIHSDLMPWHEAMDFRPENPDSPRRPRKMPSREHFRNRNSTMRNIGRMIPYIFSLLGSTFFEIARYANQKAKEAVQLRNEKLITEMKFLKSQINPHFLFNSLNNIYTLTVIKSDAAPDNLLKLSHMLRYMLYDCKADQVPLEKEIKYIKDFIDLNKLKDSQGLNIQVNLDENRPNLQVAPLLFVPFIENAFKHSKIEDLENGWIKIDLKTEDNAIHFSVQNSIPKNQFSKDKIGGIGLKNVKRQLELIYPEKHNLKVHSNENQFNIDLKIKL